MVVRALLCIIRLEKCRFRLNVINERMEDQLQVIPTCFECNQREEEDRFLFRSRLIPASGDKDRDIISARGGASSWLCVD